MRACVWVVPAVLGLGVVGCGSGSAEDRPPDGGAVPVSATVADPPATSGPTGPLDGGVPVADAGRVSAEATLTAFPPRAMVRVGGTTYATGVGWIGAYRGSGLLLSADGALRRALGTDGQISDAVADGRGGAYVAGEFSRVGALHRTAVVHVGPDGAVDRRFVVRGLRFVNALALGGGRLYVGGTLLGTDGRPEARGRGLLAVDARTGRRLNGFRAPATGRISELELHGGRLFAGGALPEPRYRKGEDGRLVPVPGDVALPVDALDPGTGRPDPGFAPPRIPPSVRGQVTALRVVAGRLWVATGFPGSAEQTALRLLRPSDGGLVATPEARGAVSEVVADGDRALLVGGLTRADGGRDLAQAFDGRTGERRPGFAVPAGGRGEVATDALIRGGRLVLAGAGRRSGGVAAERLRAGDRGPVRAHGFVDAVRLRDGAADRRLRAPAPDADVHALVRLGDGLLAGGAFAGADPRATDLAAFDAATGRPSAAPVPAVPGALEVTSAGGLVWTTDGTSLIAFDPATGTVRHRARLPHRGHEVTDRVGRYRVPADVRLTAAGGRVFVFAGAHGASAGDRGIVAYDATTAKPVPFRLPLPSARDAGPPQLLGVGDVLYAGGSFVRRRASGQQADLAVLKVDPRTGALDEAFDPHVDGPVAALGTQGPGRPLFLAGHFRASPRAQRPGTLLAVDPATGARDSSIGAAPLRSDPGGPISVTADRAVLRVLEGRLAGVAFDRAGRRVPTAVRGARSLSTTDGADLVAASAPGLLGFHTPAGYGLIQRRTAR